MDTCTDAQIVFPLLIAAQWDGQHYSIDSTHPLRDTLLAWDDRYARRIEHNRQIGERYYSEAPAYRNG